MIMGRMGGMPVMMIPSMSRTFRMGRIPVTMTNGGAMVFNMRRG